MTEKIGRSASPGRHALRTYQPPASRSAPLRKLPAAPAGPCPRLNCTPHNRTSHNPYNLYNTRLRQLLAVLALAAQAHQQQPDVQAEGGVLLLELSWDAHRCMREVERGMGLLGE